MNITKLNSVSELDLIASFSHEIKNPLNATMTGSSCLNEYINKIKELLPEKQIISKEYSEISSLLNDSQEAVNLINDGNNRIKQILGNLQSNLKLGEVSKEYYNFKQGIESCIVLFEKQIESQNITVQTEIDSQANIICEQGEINQVITNLLVNSCDAMPTGGKIVLSCKINNNEIEVKFSDNGSGIPKEHQKSIFKPYFTTKKASKGMGLGLHISSQIIKKHGGKMQLLETSRGTTFLIKLPVQCNHNLNN